MFNSNLNVDDLNALSKGNMTEHVGIEYIEIGEDYIKAKMPVDHRTTQPFGLLHGGASVVLAETLGSVAAMLTINTEEQFCVGLEINANHVKSATKGFVYGTTKPIHVGKKTQIWEIRIENEKQELVCISRITMAILGRKK